MRSFLSRCIQKVLRADGYLVSLLRASLCRGLLQHWLPALVAANCRYHQGRFQFILHSTCKFIGCVIIKPHPPPHEVNPSSLCHNPYYSNLTTTVCVFVIKFKPSPFLKEGTIGHLNRWFFKTFTSNFYCKKRLLYVQNLVLRLELWRDF